MEPRLDRLYQDIVEQIKESQVKLGYSYETVNLYYKKDGLESRLGVAVGSLRETAKLLSDSTQFSNTPLGAIDFAPSRGRLQVTVPADGVKYVHENVPSSDFLVAIVALFGTCGGVSQEQVVALFQQFGDFQLQPSPQGADFDYQIHFQDPAIDPYFYCFKQEGQLLTYHRLSPEDYVTRTA